MIEKYSRFETNFLGTFHTICPFCPKICVIHAHNFLPNSLLFHKLVCLTLDKYYENKRCHDIGSKWKADHNELTIKIRSRIDNSSSIFSFCPTSLL